MFSWHKTIHAKFLCMKSLYLLLSSMDQFQGRSPQFLIERRAGRFHMQSSCFGIFLQTTHTIAALKWESLRFIMVVNLTL